MAEAINQALVDAILAAEIETVARSSVREFMEPGQKFCFHHDDFADDPARTNFNMTVETTVRELKLLVFRIALVNSNCWESSGNTRQASANDVATLSTTRAAAILSVIQVLVAQVGAVNDGDPFGQFHGHQRLNGPRLATRVSPTSFILHLGAFMDLADCEIRTAVFQDPATVAAAILKRPTLNDREVTVPQAMKPMFGTAISGLGNALKTSNQLFVLSLISLFKTGHHWTPETVEILRRLCGAIGLLPEYADSVFWCRVVVHPISINFRIAYMAHLHAVNPLRQEVITRCGGTGHGIAKLNLMWAIVLWARARGERQYEVYLFEIFHKANRGTAFRTMMAAFRNQAGVHESAGLAGVPNFNRCALNNFGFSSMDGTNVVQNTMPATRAWYTLRRTDVESIEDMKAPVLELIAVIGDRIAQSLCFGAAAGVSGASKDNVRARLATIKTAMDRAAGAAAVTYGGKLLVDAEVAAPAGELAALLGTA